MLHPTCPSPKSLPTLSERDELQGIACLRDKNNIGMTRKEMVSLISILFSVSNKAAENHFDYLVRQKKFPEHFQVIQLLSLQARLLKAQSSQNLHLFLLHLELSQKFQVVTLQLSSWMGCAFSRIQILMGRKERAS